MRRKKRPALVLYAPEIFRDPQFIDWLNGAGTIVATYHQRKQPPGPYSDVFVLVDPSLNGEGMDSDMPENVWRQILLACAHEFTPNGRGEHVCVQLVNAP